jgi:hypothetical protein
MFTKDTTKNIAILNKKYCLIKDSLSLLNETDNSVIILNICNNMNTFGAGFNKIIAESFPLAKENYHLIGPSKLKMSLGYTQFIKAKHNPKYKNNIIVANMICQTGIISNHNTRPFNYFFFGNCLSKVQNFIKNYNSENETRVHLYSPKFHMGISGCNWSFVQELFLDIIKKPTYTEVYERYS